MTTGIYTNTWLLRLVLSVNAATVNKEGNLKCTFIIIMESGHCKPGVLLIPHNSFC